MKRFTKVLALLLVCCMVLSFVACGNDTQQASVGGNKNPIISDEISNLLGDTEYDVKVDENNNTFIQLGGKDTKENIESINVKNDLFEGDVLDMTPKGEYHEGVVLVKFEKNFDANAFGTLEYISAETLFEGSKWYSVKLKDESKTEEAVEYLSKLGTFEKVDYDYVMGVTAEVDSAKVTDNPNYDKQVNLGVHNIPHGWTQNGKHPGGSSDVIVAVIDTGVDYNHLDLRNNIWVNTAEIANNGKDDDGNGYIDDIYGWDCVGNDKDPMDDNGHGTHVAGIIAAENNKIGGIGVAYNCKVMVLKAGNSSGYFNNSDIAEAVQYAYMNGASVINMSFGGSNISVAVEEALENAYNSCVLVAAAGNDGACNNLGCKTCEKVGVSYPAALPYVIGVMSTDKDGKHISSFSNYDHNPHNSVEYEVYAVGEGVGSTWPSNKYACLNGTSMAAPTVSGIAALLRSYHPDREVYSTKYIQSQIVNTGTVNPYNFFVEDTDGAHSVADVYEAMTRIPTPEVNLYDYYIDDSTAINSANNGNGVVDAGETVRLYVSLHNRGGVATDVNVAINVNRGEGLVDPYFTLVNNTITLSDIGTYSVRESGDKYFEIVISSDCPNDYLVDFNIRYTYKNGMNEKDNTNYSGDGKAQFNVSRGYYLPSVFNEDTTYKADKLYIVSEDVVIPEGVTVTFEEGCQIQFYDDREYFSSPRFIVYGNLNFMGSQTEMVRISPNERHSDFICEIYTYNEGCVYMYYVECINLQLGEPNYHAGSSQIHHSNILGSKSYINYYTRGTISHCYASLYVHTIANSYVEHKLYIMAYFMFGNYFMMKSAMYIEPNKYQNSEFKNNILNSSAKNDFSYLRIENDKTIFENNFFDSYSLETAYTLFLSGLTTTQNSNNTFSKVFQNNANQLIEGYINANGVPVIDVFNSNNNSDELWPYVVSVEMFDKDGNAITTVGKEEIKARVTFNRPMDTTKDTYLTFGTIEPYADYRINGEYVSDTVWEGTYTLKAQIENGQNFLKVNNACAAEDQTKTVFGEYHLHEFTIDTTATMSMNLQAFPKENGIELNFAQDDYDTLLGYNIYRSESKDGNYVKLNPAILLPDETVFLDENAEPGKTYWYTYTVVLTDFSESNPAGKVTATAMDTMSPSLYHTPVNQGYENNNLVISATASDNVAIEKVTLYYRAVGETAWKSLTMSKQNDKYSATIFGSDITLAGLEYYIVATDGINAVMKGSADMPYTVVVKSADSLLGLGDVDGNGTVTTKDALMLMQCINGDLILTDDQFKRADLNKDNILSSAEALRILQYINGKITTLEM